MTAKFVRPLVAGALMTVLATTHSAADSIDYAAGGYDISTDVDRVNDVYYGQNQLTIAKTVDSYYEGVHQGTVTLAGSLQPVSDGFMRLSSRATDFTLGNFFSEDVRDVAYFSYRDRITYLGAGAPSSLRLTFAISGSLGFDHAFEPLFVTGGFAGFGIGAQNGFNFIGPNLGGAPSVVGLGSGYDVATDQQKLTVSTSETVSFSSLELVGTTLSFAGTYTFDVALSPYGTYDFGLYALTNNIVSHDNSSFVDASHTVSFGQVFLPDGTAIDPGLLSFESGFRFQPSTVPEPSSYMLLGIGLIGCLVHTAQKRIQLAASTGV
jgi:PEP-CTERM motif